MTEPGNALVPAAPQALSPVAVALAAQAKAAVESRYLMALQRPRNLFDVAVRLNQAMAIPSCADSAEYALPRGGKTIVGPSIRFAEEAIRAMTNIMVQVEVTHDDAEKRYVRVTMTDLEANYPISRELVIEKVIERQKLRAGQEVLGRRQNSRGEQVYLVAVTEDDMTIKQAAAVSKIMRTDGLRLVPTHIKEDALAIARETRANRDAADPLAVAKKLVAAFAGEGVTAADLEALMGKSLDALRNSSDLDLLRGVLTGLREGIPWADIIGIAKPTAAEGEAPKTAKQGLDALRAHLAVVAPPKKRKAPETVTEAQAKADPDADDDLKFDQELAEREDRS